MEEMLRKHCTDPATGVFEAVAYVVVTCVTPSFIDPGFGRVSSSKYTLPEDPAFSQANYRGRPGRAKTGLLGIANQGNTCYLNSILQSLFHTRLLRKLVYSMPVKWHRRGEQPGGGDTTKAPSGRADLVAAVATQSSSSCTAASGGAIVLDDDDDDVVMVECAPAAGAGAGASNSGGACGGKSGSDKLTPDQLRRFGLDTVSDKNMRMIGALQQLFWSLEACNDLDDGVTSSQALTGSFGWNGGEVWQQQDAHEMLRILLDLLEDRLKGTPLAHGVRSLLEGFYVTTTRVPSSGFHSNPRVESFKDVQLVVDGNRSILDAFRSICRDEELSGREQYEMPDGSGKVDAVRRVRFRSLPPVLHLQLIRFTFDYASGSKRKINDRCAYPDRLDLSEFLEEPEEEPEEEGGGGEDSDGSDAGGTPGSGSGAGATAAAVASGAGAACTGLPAHAQATLDALNRVGAASTAVTAESTSAAPAARHRRGPARPPAVYRLHSVLVHQGHVNGGHYYAYVRPRMYAEREADGCAAVTSDEPSAAAESSPSSSGAPATSAEPPSAAAPGAAASDAPAPADPAAESLRSAKWRVFSLAHAADPAFDAGAAWGASAASETSEVVGDSPPAPTQQQPPGGAPAADAPPSVGTKRPRRGASGGGSVVDADEEEAPSKLARLGSGATADSDVVDVTPDGEPAAHTPASTAGLTPTAHARLVDNGDADGFDEEPDDPAAVAGAGAVAAVVADAEHEAPGALYDPGQDEYGEDSLLSPTWGAPKAAASAAAGAGAGAASSGAVAPAAAAPTKPSLSSSTDPSTLSREALNAHGGWFKLNDTNVSVATVGEAIFRNFGGPPVDGREASSSTDSDSSGRSAYYLVYIREDAIPDVMFDPEGLPPLPQSLEGCVVAGDEGRGGAVDAVEARSKRLAAVAPAALVAGPPGNGAASPVALSSAVDVGPVPSAGVAKPPASKGAPVAPTSASAGSSQTVIDLLDDDEDDVHALDEDEQMQRVLAESAAAAAKSQQASASASASASGVTDLDFEDVDVDEDSGRLGSSGAILQPPKKKKGGASSGAGATSSSSARVIFDDTDVAVADEDASPYGSDSRSTGGRLRWYVDITMPVPAEVVARCSYLSGVEKAEREAEAAAKRAIEARQPAAVHIITDAHLGSAVHPGGVVGKDLDLDAYAGLRSAIVLPVTMGTTQSGMYRAVGEALGLPPGGFLLWVAAKRNGDNCVRAYHVVPFCDGDPYVPSSESPVERYGWDSAARTSGAPAADRWVAEQRNKRGRHTLSQLAAARLTNHTHGDALIPLQLEAGGGVSDAAAVDARAAMHTRYQGSPLERAWYDAGAALAARPLDPWAEALAGASPSQLGFGLQSVPPAAGAGSSGAAAEALRDSIAPPAASSQHDSTRRLMGPTGYGPWAAWTHLGAPGGLADGSHLRNATSFVFYLQLLPTPENARMLHAAACVGAAVQTGTPPTPAGLAPLLAALSPRSAPPADSSAGGSDDSDDVIMDDGSPRTASPSSPSAAAGTGTGAGAASSSSSSAAAAATGAGAGAAPSDSSTPTDPSLGLVPHPAIVALAPGLTRALRNFSAWLGVLLRASAGPSFQFFDFESCVGSAAYGSKRDDVRISHPEAWQELLAVTLTDESNAGMFPGPASMGPGGGVPHSAPWPSHLALSQSPLSAWPVLPPPVLRRLVSDLQMSFPEDTAPPVAHMAFRPWLRAVHVFRYNTDASGVVGPVAATLPSTPFPVAASFPAADHESFLGTVLLPTHASIGDARAMIAMWLGLLPPLETVFPELVQCGVPLLHLRDLQPGSWVAQLAGIKPPANSVETMLRPALASALRERLRIYEAYSSHDGVEKEADDAALDVRWTMEQSPANPMITLTGDVWWLQFSDADVLAWAKQPGAVGRTGPAAPTSGNGASSASPSGSSSFGGFSGSAGGSTRGKKMLEGAQFAHAQSSLASLITSSHAHTARMHSSGGAVHSIDDDDDQIDVEDEVEADAFAAFLGETGEPSVKRRRGQGGASSPPAAAGSGGGQHPPPGQMVAWYAAHPASLAALRAGGGQAGVAAAPAPQFFAQPPPSAPMLGFPPLSQFYQAQPPAKKWQPMEAAARLKNCSGIISVQVHFSGLLPVFTGAPGRWSLHRANTASVAPFLPALLPASGAFFAVLTVHPQTLSASSSGDTARSCLRYNNAPQTGPDGNSAWAVAAATAMRAVPRTNDGAATAASVSPSGVQGMVAPVLPSAWRLVVHKILKMVRFALLSVLIDAAVRSGMEDSDGQIALLALEDVGLFPTAPLVSTALVYGLRPQLLEVPVPLPAAAGFQLPGTPPLLLPLEVHVAKTANYKAFQGEIADAFTARGAMVVNTLVARTLAQWLNAQLSSVQHSTEAGQGASSSSDGGGRKRGRGEDSSAPAGLSRMDEAVLTSVQLLCVAPHAFSFADPTQPAVDRHLLPASRLLLRTPKSSGAPVQSNAEKKTSSKRTSDPRYPEEGDDLHTIHPNVDGLVDGTQGALDAWTVRGGSGGAPWATSPFNVVAQLLDRGVSANADKARDSACVPTVWAGFDPLTWDAASDLPPLRTARVSQPAGRQVALFSARKSTPLAAVQRAMIMAFLGLNSESVTALLGYGLELRITVYRVVTVRDGGSGGRDAAPASGEAAKGKPKSAPTGPAPLPGQRTLNFGGLKTAAAPSPAPAAAPSAASSPSLPSAPAAAPTMESPAAPPAPLRSWAAPVAMMAQMDTWEDVVETIAAVLSAAAEKPSKRDPAAAAIARALSVPDLSHAVTTAVVMVEPVAGPEAKPDFPMVRSSPSSAASGPRSSGATPALSASASSASASPDEPVIHGATALLQGSRVMLPTAWRNPPPAPAVPHGSDVPYSHAWVNFGLRLPSTGALAALLPAATPGAAPAPASPASATPEKPALHASLPASASSGSGSAPPVKRSLDIAGFFTSSAGKKKAAPAPSPSAPAPAAASSASGSPEANSGEEPTGASPTVSAPASSSAPEATTSPAAAAASVAPTVAPDGGVALSAGRSVLLRVSGNDAWGCVLLQAGLRLGLIPLKSLHRSPDATAAVALELATTLGYGAGRQFVLANAVRDSLASCAGQVLRPWPVHPAASLSPSASEDSMDVDGDPVTDPSEMPSAASAVARSSSLILPLTWQKKAVGNAPRAQLSPEGTPVRISEPYSPPPIPSGGGGGGAAARQLPPPPPPPVGLSVDTSAHPSRGSPDVGGAGVTSLSGGSSSLECLTAAGSAIATATSARSVLSKGAEASIAQRIASGKSANAASATSGGRNSGGSLAGGDDPAWAVGHGAGPASGGSKLGAITLAADSLAANGDFNEDEALEAALAMSKEEAPAAAAAAAEAADSECIEILSDSDDDGDDGPVVPSVKRARTPPTPPQRSPPALTQSRLRTYGKGASSSSSSNVNGGGVLTAGSSSRAVPPANEGSSLAPLPRIALASLWEAGAAVHAVAPSSVSEHGAHEQAGADVDDSAAAVDSDAERSFLDPAPLMAIFRSCRATDANSPGCPDLPAVSPFGQTSLRGKAGSGSGGGSSGGAGLSSFFKATGAAASSSSSVAAASGGQAPAELRKRLAVHVLTVLFDAVGAVQLAASLAARPPPVVLADPGLAPPPSRRAGGALTALAAWTGEHCVTGGLLPCTPSVDLLHATHDALPPPALHAGHGDLVALLDANVSLWDSEALLRATLEKGDRKREGAASAAAALVDVDSVMGDTGSLTSDSKDKQAKKPAAPKPKERGIQIG